MNAHLQSIEHAFDNYWDEINIEADEEYKHFEYTEVYGNIFCVQDNSTVNAINIWYVKYSKIVLPIAGSISSTYMQSLNGFILTKDLTISMNVLE